MNYCSLPGVVCPPPEPWQLFMCVFIGWSSLMTIAGLAVETYRYRLHEMPPWLAVIGALVFLSHHPIGLMFQLLAYILFYAYAPWGASLVVTVFGLYGYTTFWYFLMGPRFWQMASRR